MFCDKDPQYAIIISLIWKLLCDKNYFKYCHCSLSGAEEGRPLMQIEGLYS